jgi:multidrug resistance efflux pump
MTLDNPDVPDYRNAQHTAVESELVSVREQLRGTEAELARVNAELSQVRQTLERASAAWRTLFKLLG